VCGALGAPDGGLGDGDAGAGLEVGGGGLRCSTSTHEGAGETGFGVFALGLVLAASRRRRR
jgi:MYXO-CTERM domain-containing protein